MCLYLILLKEGFKQCAECYRIKEQSITKLKKWSKKEWDEVRVRACFELGHESGLELASSYCKEGKTISCMIWCLSYKNMPGAKRAIIILILRSGVMSLGTHEEDAI